MTMFARLKRDSGGAATVEFGLLGPIVITMMLGVLQMGVAMWSYNSLRSVASETARYAVTNYQAANKISASSISAQATSIATNTPYGLTADNLSITVTTAATQRVSGATEMTLMMTYNVPTMASIVGLGSIRLNYSRPIFLLT